MRREKRIRNAGETLCSCIRLQLCILYTMIKQDRFGGCLYTHTDIAYIYIYSDIEYDVILTRVLI